MAHMFEKHYTLDQANAMIPHVRRLFAEVRTLLHSTSAKTQTDEEVDPFQLSSTSNGHGSSNGNGSVNGHAPYDELKKSDQNLKQSLKSSDKLAGLEPEEAAATADYSDWTDEKRHEAAYRLLNALQSQGIVIQDVERGLIDFPSLYEGREVFLCYELADGHSIQFFHETSAGYAGRKHISELEK